MNIGLYFGSFNPIHIGHLIIANFVAENTDVDQVWLIVSPQNPLKPQRSLLNEYHRLHLVRQAIGDNVKLKASDIEFKLPKPSFTIDTLTFLTEKYPIYSFSIVLGSDSYLNLPRWKNYELLLKSYPLLVYERPSFAIQQATLPAGVQVLKAPLLDISATMIRNMIKSGKSVRYLLPEAVLEEVELNNYYK